MMFALQVSALLLVVAMLGLLIEVVLILRERRLDVRERGSS